MIAEIGHFAITLALIMALVQGIAPLVGAARDNAAWMGLAKPAARGPFRTRPELSPQKCSLRFAACDIYVCG